MAIPPMQNLQKKIMDLGIDGIGLYAGDKLTETIRDFTYSFIDKNLGIYSDGAVKILLSMLDLVVPQISTMPYVGDWLELWGRDGVRSVVKAVVDKPTYCRADDSNTLHCYNFDALPTAIYIDGNAVSGYTTSGTPDDFTISLPSPLSSGKHDLMVAGKKKAFYGWVKV